MPGSDVNHPPAGISDITAKIWTQGVQNRCWQRSALAVSIRVSQNHEVSMAVSTRFLEMGVPESVTAMLQDSHIKDR